MQSREALRPHARGRALGWVLAACVAFALTCVLAAPALAAYENVPTPAVEGPIATSPSSQIFMRTNVNLAEYGYTEEEFFLSGTGYTYTTTGAVNVTGTKITTGGPNENGTYPFKTRIVVRRPIDPAKFNGKVVAEWQNVTAGFDLEPEWDGNPYGMMKAGYTYVAVDAQNAGISGLKKYNAERYGSLEVGPAGDALSYDVYAAALKAIRGDGTGVQPLGELTSKITNVTASGASQSCQRLTTDYNKVAPLQEIADDYLLTDCTNAVRADRPEKILRVIAEFENKIQQTEAEYPAAPNLRHWEAAGGSHVPFMVGANWEPLINRDVGPAESFCSKTPLFSTVDWPYAVDAGLAELIAWQNGGSPPPAAPRGEYVNPTTLKRNSLGIALGGLRLPEVEVPVVVDLAENSAHPAPNPYPFSAFCTLQGQHQPISEETLNSMYANIGEYVSDVRADAEKLQGEGFLIQEGVERIVAQAEEFPRLRPTTPSVSGSPSSGSFGLSWVGPKPSHPSSIVPKFVEMTPTYEVQRRNAQGGEWTTVASGLSEPAYSVTGGETGVYDYRVRSTTVEPAHQLEPEMTYVSPFSAQTQVAVGFNTVTGNVKGKVTVKSGEGVRLVSGSKVSGQIVIKPGGSLDVEGGTVSGGIRGKGANVVRVCGASVAGGVSLVGGTGAVQLGGTSDGCSPNTFNGNVTVKSTSAPVSMEGNTVSGSVKVRSNTVSTVVTGNSIAANLTVKSNSGSVTDTPNEVEGKEKVQ